MAGKATKLGPGKLTIGDATTGLDLSCQLSGAWVKFDKDAEDATPVLCGEDIAGAVSYPAKLSGTVLLDLSDEGMVDFTWLHKGEQHSFVFEPSTADGKAATGTVTVDPLDVGGDEVKKNMSTDFEWDIVGDPVWGATPVTPLAAARTPVTAGLD